MLLFSDSQEKEALSLLNDTCPREDRQSTLNEIGYCNNDQFVALILYFVKSFYRV